MSAIRRFIAIVFAFAVLQTPKIATACSVCSAGREEENADAFLWMTLMLSVLPPLMVGGIIYGIVRYIRAHELKQEALAAETLDSIAPPFDPAAALQSSKSS